MMMMMMMMALMKYLYSLFSFFCFLFHSSISAEEEAEDLPVPQRYYPDSLVELTRTARFTEDEIKRIYRGFKAECPTGIVKEDTFKGIYSQFFPLGGKDN